MKNKRNGKADVILLVVLIILVCGVGGYLIWTNMSKTNDTAKTNGGENAVNPSSTQTNITNNTSSNSVKEETFVFNQEEVNKKLSANEYGKVVQVLISAKTNNSDGSFNNGTFTNKEMFMPLLVYMREFGLYSTKIEDIKKQSLKLFGKEIDLIELSNANYYNLKIEGDEAVIDGPGASFGIEFYNATNLVKNSDGTYKLSFDIINYTSDENGVTKHPEDVLSSYELTYSKNGEDYTVLSLNRTYKK